MAIQAKTALLIVDMQNCFLESLRNTKSYDEVCDHINYVAGILRKSDNIVVLIQDIERLGEIGEEQLSIVEDIHTKDGDLRVRKIPSNAFWQTDLEGILKKAGVEFVIVSGYSAEDCVLFTYNGALERGFKASILQSGILSEYPEQIASIYKKRHIISYPVLEFLYFE